ncbi:MAG: hypothetical protein LBF19_06655 [Prevotellaceae bacterium]|jgi:hypothetical protein|nr:hypothetical protein [Prevotellaceae bacterium]
MKNIFILLVSISMLSVAACTESEPALSGSDDGQALRRSPAVTLSDSVSIEVTLMNTADSTTLYAVSGSHKPSNNFLLTGGSGGASYRSSEDGDSWWSAQNTYPVGTINALSCSRNTNGYYQNWKYCMAACDNGIWTYDLANAGNYWWPLLQGNEYTFTATTNYQDPRGWAVFWNIAGLRDSIPCLYYYYYFHDGTYSYFYELDASMFENKITDMTNMYSLPVIAVTDGGEIASTGSMPGDIFEIVHDFDTALYATCLFFTEYSDSTKIFVAGDNGFMKYAMVTDQYTWFSITSPGITSRINSMATDCDEFGAGGSILVAGGAGGQFAYSIDDGVTWTPYDIGFGTSDIHDITYYDYDNSFYAVGAGGKIARIKISIE